MYRIFISYRRSDSESFSGRLRDRLRAEFGKRAVFMDTSTIPGGAKFDEAIAQNLKSCKVFITVIGKSWLDCRNDAGQRRLDDPGDWVRKEVAQALAREDLLVVPVIFGGAAMPGSESLPPDLQSLARRNAVSINDADFDSDVARLIEACESQVPRPRRWPWVAGAAAALLATVGGWLWFDSSSLELRGVYVVPDRKIYESLPVGKDGGGERHYLTVSLSKGGKKFDDLDFIRKAVFVAGKQGLDASTRPQDIEALRKEVAQHFKMKGSDDYDAVAARLSSDPIIARSLTVQPGARIEVEYGLLLPDAVGQLAKSLQTRCVFTVPRKPAQQSPVLYVAKISPDCKSTG